MAEANTNIMFECSLCFGGKENFCIENKSVKAVKVL